MGLLGGSEDQIQSHHMNHPRREDLLLPCIVVPRGLGAGTEGHQAVLLFLQG